MIAQERIVRQVPSQLKLVNPSPVQTPQNDNWLYAGTDEAWLNVDYSQPPYSICIEASTTAYKLPQYEEDLDCYSNEPGKSYEQIWLEVAEFKTSASPDDYDEF
ncbi:MAG: hypothetical protein F6K08_05135 [Okeania sp. SIO1H6]|nr:hypothetical protein [Okeania sp. SIO1H6]